MTNAFQDALKALLPTIQLIPKDDVKTPDMPPKSVAEEALYTHKWCQVDKESLTGRGLDWELVEQLPMRILAFEEAQSNWNNVRWGR